VKTLTKSKRFGLSFVLGAALVALVPVQASAQVDPLIQKFQNWINMVDGIKYTAQQGNNITPASQLSSYYQYIDESGKFVTRQEAIDGARMALNEIKIASDIEVAAVEGAGQELTAEQRFYVGRLTADLSETDLALDALTENLNELSAGFLAVHMLLEALGNISQDLQYKAATIQGLYGEVLNFHADLYAGVQNGPWYCWYWYWYLGGSSTMQQVQSDIQRALDIYDPMNGELSYGVEAWMIDFILPGQNPIQDSAMRISEMESLRDDMWGGIEISAEWVDCYFSGFCQL
jgi:hypothetical protein